MVPFPIRWLDMEAHEIAKLRPQAFNFLAVIEIH